MNDDTPTSLDSYLTASESWAAARDRTEQRSRRIAWIVAGCATLVAVCEGLALAALAPLKTVEPYTLLVDRQTGHVEALKPTTRGAITPDAALIRSMLVQYVIARESFDIDSLQSDYRKIGLWTTGVERERYISGMQAGNPASPLAALPRRTLIETRILSISPLSADTAMIRFATFRTDPGGQRQEPQYWAAVIKYQFSNAAMSEEDRFINPLGFQVTRYRRDAEFPPQPVQPVQPVLVPPLQIQAPQGAQAPQVRP